MSGRKLQVDTFTRDGEHVASPSPEHTQQRWCSTWNLGLSLQYYTSNFSPVFSVLLAQS